jgi:DNA polymerase-3 subunit chi
VSAGFERYERVIEVVSLEDQDRQNARTRWKQYAEQGYSITRHDLKLRETST